MKKRINIYIEPRIYKQVAAKAKKDDRSISSLIGKILVYYLEKTKTQKPKPG